MRSLDQRVVWWSLFLAVGLITATGLGWLAVRLWAPEPSSPLPPLPATMRLTHPHLTHGTNGTVLWEVEGDEALYDQETDTLRMAAPRIRYFGPTPITAQAQHGTVHQRQGTAELMGNLTAWFGDSTIEAMAVRYHESEAQFTFLGPVTVRGPRLDLTAPAAEIYLRDERILATGGVQATLHPSGN